MKNIYSKFIATSSLILLLSLSSKSQAQDITGPSFVMAGTNVTYALVKDDGSTFISPTWTVTNGTITSTSKTAYTATVKVTWPQGVSGTVTLKDRLVTLGTKNVTILVNCSPSAIPAPPQGTLTGKYSPGQPALLHLTPGSGANTILWSTSNLFTYPDVMASGNYFTTTPLNGSTTYYAKSLNTSTGCVSNTSVQVQVNLLTSVAAVKQEAVRVEGITTGSQLPSLTTLQKSTAISYLDGLGRVHQSIALKSSPSGKDIVTPVEFDSDGRVTKSYLPYTISNGMNGAFRSSYTSELHQFYEASGDKIADDALPYATIKYESSPLGRLVEQGNVGQDMQVGSGHTQSMEYTFNLANEVRQFDLDGSSSLFYPANTLSKTIATDGNGNHSISFADKTGKTILVKRQLEEMIDNALVAYLETYYLYDDLGRIKYMITPKGVSELKASNWSQQKFVQIKDNYIHQFVYDKRGRLIEKKVPGQAWMYYGYDKLNRMVLVQDGLLHKQKKWMFIKYDRKNRPVMQGLYKNTIDTTRVLMQAILDGLYISANTTYPENNYFEVRGSAPHGYINTSFPKTNADNSPAEILSVSYYDNYDFDNNGVDDYTYTPQGLPDELTQDRASLMPTGSKRVVLGTGTWLFNYVFYDKYRRPIQVRSNNHLNSAIDNLMTTVYDFEGKVLTTKNYHNAGSGRVTTVINKYSYDTQGRLVNVYQNNNGALNDQLVVQYEYNELGQLVDKKLHNTGGTTFLQSVDYRYNIRGQLSSINNAQLSGTGVNTETNDENNDYFGIEFLYNTIESGLNNTALYDGNISAVKWKGLGSGIGSSNQKSYKYSYDKSNKLEAAIYTVKGSTAWDKEAGALNESMSYDHNGNIKNLQRSQRKHQLTQGIPSFTPEAMDDLTYSYNATIGDQLLKVEDAAISAGFNNGVNIATEYTYDMNGNLTADKNKGIDSVKYNFLGKVERVIFSNGKKLIYVYDASGSKLTMKTLQGTTLQNTTDYVNGFVYENNALSFFGSPEGRVVNIGISLEYQYSIADHQGNTRVVFSSVTPTPDAPVATLEPTNAANERSTFLKYDDVRKVNAPIFGRGTSNYSIRLSGTAKETYGLARSLAVYPGDKVKAEVYAKYVDPNSSNWTTALSNLMTTIASASSGTVFDGEGYGTTAGSTIPFAGALSHSSETGTAPKAYLNWLIYDKNYKFITGGFKRMSTTAKESGSDVPHELLQMGEVEITEPGYVYIYLSNENGIPIEVYFDDFKVTQTKSNIIQYNEYYPFGLQTANSWTRENTTGNNFLYNAATELNQTSGWYDLFYRGYDPTLGRFLQVDPLAASEQATYQYAGNNPVLFNDPMGDHMNISPYEYERNAEWLAMWLGNCAALGEGGGGGGSSTYRSADQMLQQETYNRQVRSDLASGDTYVTAQAIALYGGNTYNESNGLTIGYDMDGNAVIKLPVTTTSYMSYEGVRSIPSTKRTVSFHTIGEIIDMGLFQQTQGDGDPLLNTHGLRVYTMDQFLEEYKGKSYFEIINERPKRDGLPGGPKIRMVVNPKDGKIMDMRHVMVVGFGGGSFIGLGFEVLQYLGPLVGKDTRGSAFDKQDFYSNDIGANFFSYTLFTGNLGKDWSTTFYNYLNK